MSAGGQAGPDLREALAGLPVAACVLDRARRVVAANPAFRQAAGLAAGALPPGLPALDLFRLLAGRGVLGPGEADALDPAAIHHLPGRGADGSALKIHLVPLGDPAAPSGQIVCMLAPAPDEDAVRRRAETLENILRHVPSGICVFGPDGRVIAVNESYPRMVFGGAVAVGDLLTDLIRRRAASGGYGPGTVEDIVRARLAVDRSRPEQRRRRQPDGTTIEVRTAPLPGGGHVSVVTDVTGLVQAEEALSERIAVMDAMLAHIRHGIVLWDEAGRVVASNRIAAELFGYPPELLVPGRTHREIIAAMLERGGFGTGPEAAARARAVLEQDRTRRQRTQRVTPGGRVLEIRSDPTPAGGFITTVTDITDARAAERELERARAEAEAANQAKSRFLATMSHELRTPLNAVIGFSDALVRQPGEEREQIAEFAAMINAAGRQLLGLIDTILDVARIEAGRFDLSADRVDVMHLVASCVRQAAASAAAAEVTLVTEMPDFVPQLRGDERRLRQVLAQLIANAVKFTGPGGSVRIAAELAEGGDLLLRVSDTGIGISDGELERVFEPFVQLDTSLARRFEGSGLGLYVARALTAAHDGTLALTSRVGQGTTALLRFPAGRLIHPRGAGGALAPAARHAPPKSKEPP